MSNRKIFAEIYSKGVWGNGSSSKPLSGSGSNPDNARPYVNLIKEFIQSRSVSSVLDFGHGDWEMWKEYSFEGVDYLGVDVAEGLSEKINSKYGNELRKFQFLDLAHEQLPNRDLLICKDVLQHLQIADIKDFLASCLNFKHVIICNDIYVKSSLIFEFKEILQIRRRLKRLKSKKNPFFVQRRRNNSSIKSGQFRGIDLERYPFKGILRKFDVDVLLDFDGPQRPGIRKRVYLLSRKSLIN